MTRRRSQTSSARDAGAGAAGRPRPRAFTLVEMMISLSMCAVLMGACVSLVMIASKSMASETSNVGTDAISARIAADQICDDLRVATAVTEQTAKAITLVVPDRDGDGSAETIRYAWGGNAGDPLTRNYNSRGAATLAANVYKLNFAYLSKTAGKPAPVEGSEQTYAFHAPSSGTSTFALTSTAWPAGYFKPSLANNAVSWNVTRCRFKMTTTTLLGTVTARLRYADSAGAPTGADLATGSVTTTLLTNGSSTWFDFTFSATPALDISKGVCLVVSYSGSGTVANVEFDTANSDSSLRYATSTDSGSSWVTPVSTKALSFYAWGKVTTQDSETYDFQALPAKP